MKTKEVNESIKRHIKSFITIKDLKSQIEAVKYPAMNTDREALDYIIQGGQFLIYYFEIKKYLIRIKAISKNTSISDSKAWELYKNLIIINGLEMIK